MSSIVPWRIGASAPLVQVTSKKTRHEGGAEGSASPGTTLTSAEGAAAVPPSGPKTYLGTGGRPVGKSYLGGDGTGTGTGAGVGVGVGVGLAAGLGLGVAHVPLAP